MLKVRAEGKKGPWLVVLRFFFVGLRDLLDAHQQSEQVILFSVRTVRHVVVDSHCRG